MTKKTIKPITPGEVLMKEFLKLFKLSQYRLAKDINVLPRRINEIVHSDREVSVDTALRLAKYFNISLQFWLNLQTKYNLESYKAKKARKIQKEVGVFNLVLTT